MCVCVCVYLGNALNEEDLDTVTLPVHDLSEWLAWLGFGKKLISQVGTTTFVH